MVGGGGGGGWGEWSKILFSKKLTTSENAPLNRSKVSNALTTSFSVKHINVKPRTNPPIVNGMRLKTEIRNWVFQIASVVKSSSPPKRVISIPIEQSNKNSVNVSTSLVKKIRFLEIPNATLCFTILISDPNNCRLTKKPINKISGNTDNTFKYKKRFVP